MRSSSTAKALQSSFASKRVWCPICRTVTGRRQSNAPKFCKLCEERGVIERDDRRTFCKACRTPKGHPSARVATSDCDKCDGLGMVTP